MPAPELLDDIGQRLARFWLQFVRDNEIGSRRQHRFGRGAGGVVDLAHSRLAKTTLGHIDDPLEGEIIGALADNAEIGHRIADFLPFIKARAADDAVIQPERHEPLFEFAHLEGGAHEDCHVVERMALALQLLDFLANRAGFLFGIPARMHGHLVVLGVRLLGEQRLAEAALIMGDQMGGSAENMLGRAVIAFKPHHLGAGKIALEAEDVFHLRTAPAIDRLVIVTHAADVGRLVLRALCEKPQPQILRRVGVLILVNKDVAEFAVIVGEHIRMRAEQTDRQAEKIAEIDRIQRLQARLIGREKRAAFSVGKGTGIALRDFRRSKSLVLPAVDHLCELAGRPALVVDAFGLDQLLDQPDHIVGVENGEIGAQADKFGMAAQKFHTDRMEGAEPGHALDSAADQNADALLHLARGLVRKGDGQDL